MDIQNNFTIRNNIYPKYRPQTLHLLDKNSKIDVPKMPESKGSLFVKVDATKAKGGRVGDNKRGGDDKN